MRIKICGVTTVEEAIACADAGADAVGVNFVPSSRRIVTEATALEIVRCVGKRLLVVGVVADLEASEMASLRSRVGLGCLQLHGNESSATLAMLLPDAYKAIRIADAADVALADGYGGACILVDAKSTASLGGTGATFEWSLVRGLARRRKLVLAGGLTPKNVAAAVALVRPAWVDVASGVEVEGQGRKDMAKVKEFIERARETASRAT